MKDIQNKNRPNTAGNNANRSSEKMDQKPGSVNKGKPQPNKTGNPKR